MTVKLHRPRIWQVAIPLGLFAYLSLVWPALRERVVAIGRATAHVVTHPLVLIPLLALVVFLVVAVVRREWSAEAGSTKPRAAGDDVMVGVAMVGVWMVGFPLAMLAVYGRFATPETDPTWWMLGGLGGFAMVPTIAAVLWSRRHRTVEEETSPAGGLSTPDVLHDATTTDYVEVHELWIALPAREATELADALAVIPRERAHRACDLVAARLSEGVRVMSSRARVPVRGEPSRLAHELARRRAAVEARSYRTQDDVGFRGVARTTRGEENLDGTAVVSFLLAAHPTGVAPVDASQSDALRAHLPTIVPIDPSHVLALEVTTVPAAGWSLGAEALAEAFPELATLR